MKKQLHEQEKSLHQLECDTHFGKLVGRIRKEHLTVTNPPIVLFHSNEFTPLGLDTEFAVPIRECVTGTRDFKAGLCLKTVVKDSYRIRKI